MSKGPYRTLAVTLSIALGASVCIVAGGDNDRRVRVYDGAGLDDVLRDQAIQTASGIMAGAGIGSIWNDCAAPGDCALGRGSHDAILRLLPAAAPEIPDAIDASARAGHQARAPLGYAVVDRTTRRGVIGTIFMDRVLEVANRTGTAPADLLGRVMAHEAAHLLATGDRHDHSGLMRPFWTDEELKARRQHDWLIARLAR